MAGCTTLSILFMCAAVGQSEGTPAAGLEPAQVAESDMGLELTDWRSVMVPVRKEARWDGAPLRTQRADAAPKAANAELLTHADEPNGLQPPPLSLDPVALAPADPTLELPETYVGDWKANPTLQSPEPYVANWQDDPALVNADPDSELPMVQNKPPAYRRDLPEAGEIGAQTSDSAESASSAETVATPISDEPAETGENLDDEVGEPRIMTKPPAYRYSQPQDNGTESSIAPSSWSKKVEEYDRTT